MTMTTAPTNLANAVQQIRDGMANGNITGIDPATLEALNKALQEQAAPQPRYFTVTLPGYDRTKPETKSLRVVVTARDEAVIRKHLPFACTVREVSLAGLQPADRERAERLARTDLTALCHDAYALVARHAPRDVASDTITALITDMDALLQLASEGQPPSADQVEQISARVAEARAGQLQHLVGRAVLRYIVETARAQDGGPTAEYFDALADRMLLYPEAR